MRHTMDTFVRGVGGASLGACVGGKLSACTPQTSDQSKAAAYGVQLAACRADAANFESYEQCALGVDARFGVKR